MKKNKYTIKKHINHSIEILFNKFIKYCKNNQIYDATACWDAFCKYTKEKAFDNFFSEFNKTKKEIESEVNDIKLKNGRVGEEYICNFTLPSSISSIEFSGLECFGLKVNQKTEATSGESSHQSYSISGVPKQEGNAKLVINYTFNFFGKKSNMSSHTIITITPDPKKLWKDTPTDKNIEYYQADQDDCLLPGDPEKGIRTLLAASRRGRSHAHHGAARDDNFRVAHDEETGWYVLAVADGAGSAAYSRKGSRLACDTAVESCIALVKGMDSIEETIADVEKDRNNPDLLQKTKKMAYTILVQSAFDASRAIHKEAQNTKREDREYATTLLLVMCKRLSESWFVMSFGIGDGAMAVLTKENGAMTSKLLGRPDEGEFSGQTCFITMKDIFRNSTDTINRIQVHVLDNLEAVLLMTDGVSDAKFETSAKLENAETWLALWQDLEHVTAKNDKDGLLEWLSFWSQGNHDDRTIAIMY